MRGSGVLVLEAQGDWSGYISPMSDGGSQSRSQTILPAIGASRPVAVYGHRPLTGRDFTHRSSPPQRENRNRNDG